MEMLSHPLKFLQFWIDIILLFIVLFNGLFKGVLNKLFHFTHPLTDIFAMHLGKFFAFCYAFIGHFANATCLPLYIRKGKRQAASVVRKSFVIVEYFFCIHKYKVSEFWVNCKLYFAKSG